VTEDLDRNFQFNTAIAALMEFYNFLSSSLSRKDITKKSADEAMDAMAVLLAPFAPHLAEELWEALGRDPSVTRRPWPSYDPSILVTDEISVAVQVNGKVRSQMTIPVGLDEAEVRARALKDERIVKWLEGREPKKVIYVKGKLVSIVI